MVRGLPFGPDFRRLICDGDAGNTEPLTDVSCITQKSVIEIVYDFSLTSAA